MKTLSSYLCDTWQAGDGVQETLVNPATMEELATASSAGLDLGAAMRHARDVGGPAMRAMTFAERGAMVKAVSGIIHEHREDLIPLAMENGGATRGDAKFDIDGAIGTLAVYASLGKRMGDAKMRLDGGAVDMGTTSRMQGRHIQVPRRGVAVHINAFNFPAWGFAEKAACAWIAGMPVVVKPGTITALLTHRIVELVVEAGVLAPGALALLCGRAGDLLDHTEFEDCVAFTGSAWTGRKIRSHERILSEGVRVNIEADSLNAAILGPDVDADSDTFDLFIRDVTTEMTQKAGQKCTAIRRTIVPEGMLAAVKERLAVELARIKVGVPGPKEIRMGPLSGAGAARDARANLDELLKTAEVVVGQLEGGEIAGESEDKSCFMTPLVLEVKDAAGAGAVHDVEVFGPVTTLIPYDGTATAAAAILEMGKGSLVSSFYSDDRAFSAELIENGAAFVGRLVWGSKKVAGTAPTPGSVFPHFIHGGPGRAGPGEELGAERGLDFYSQRVAVQGFGPLLDRTLGAE